MTLKKQLLVVGLSAFLSYPSLHAVLVATEGALITEINSGTALIEVTTDITLTKALPPLKTVGQTIQSDTPGVKRTIDADNKGRAFFIADGTTGVTLKDLSIENGLARGGDGGLFGGGGGAGAGGAILVGFDGGLTVDNVDFVSNSAVGGNGGDGSLTQVGRGGGGGGGLGGDGGDGGFVTGAAASIYNTGGGGGGFAAGGAGGSSGFDLTPGSSFTSSYQGSNGGASGLDGTAGTGTNIPFGAGLNGAGGLGQDSKLGVTGTPGYPTGTSACAGGPVSPSSDPPGALGGDNAGGAGGGGHIETSGPGFNFGGGGGIGGYVVGGCIDNSNHGTSFGGTLSGADEGRYGGGGGGGATFNIQTHSRLLAGGAGGLYGGGGAPVALSSLRGTSQGFGGGGGGYYNAPLVSFNAGGFDRLAQLGGTGGSGTFTDTISPGGGGAAVGGAIAVSSGATLTLKDSNMAASQTTTGGLGSVLPVGSFTTAATDGGTRGDGIMLVDTAILNLEVSSGTKTISDSIGDSSNQVSGDNADVAINKTGAGTINFAVPNDILGLLTIAAGTAELSSTGTYSGDIVIDAGATVDTLVVNALKVDSDITVSGTLDLNNNNQEVEDITVTSTGDIDLGSATLTLSGGLLSSIEGPVTGTGSINKSGSSLLHFKTGSTPSFTGPMVANGGITRFDEVPVADISGSGTVFFGLYEPTGTGAKTYAGDLLGSNDIVHFGITGTTTFTGDNSGFTGTFFVREGDIIGTHSSMPTKVVTQFDNATSDNTTATFDMSVDGTYAGNISGPGELIKNGTGILTLTNNQSFTGPLIINAGAVSVSTNDKVGFASDIQLNGGTLQADGSFTSSRSIAITGSSPIFVTTGNILNYNAPITDGTGAGELVKDGPGTLLLNANAINTHTNGVEIIDGTLQVVKEANFGAGNIDINSGGTLQAVGTISTAKTIALSSGTGNISSDATHKFTANGVISGPGVLGVTEGKVKLAGVNTYAGGTLVSGGLLQIDADNNLGAASTNIDISNNSILEVSGSFTTPRDTVLTAGGTLAVTNTYNFVHGGVISGAGPLRILNSLSGTSELSGVNTYTGGTSIDDGTLIVSADNNLGAVAGPINITNNSALRTTSSFTTARDTVLSSGGVISVDPATTLTHNGDISGSGPFTKNSTGTLILGGTNTYTGGTVINSGNLQGTTTTILGPVAVNSGSLVFDQATPGTFAAVISGPGGVIKNNTNTLTLTGTNTNTGPVSVNGGTLSVATASNLGSPSSLNLSGATLEITSPTTLSVPTTLAGSSTFDFAGAVTHSGNLSGAGSLSKQGAGTLTLTGTNSYSGGTTIDAGNLQGTTSSIQGAVAINAGSLIFDQTTTGTYTGNTSGVGGIIKNGTGTVNFTGATLSHSGDTTVSAGTLAGVFTLTGGGDLINATSGTLSPGNSIGIINVPGNFVNSGVLTIEVDNSLVAPDDVDQIIVGGTSTLNPTGTLNVQNSGPVLTGSETFIVFRSTGALTGSFGSIPLVGCFQPVFTIVPGPTNFGQITFASSGFPNDLTGNPKIIADFFDDTVFGGDLQFLENLLLNVPMDNLVDALDELSSDEYGDIAFVSQRNSNMLTRMISGHVAGLMGSGSDPASSAAAPSIGGGSASSDDDSSSHDLSSVGIQRATLWSQVIGHTFARKSLPQRQGYDAETAGIVVGSDVHLTVDLLLGVAFAQAHSDIDWRGDSADAKFDGYSAYIYSAYKMKQFTAEASLFLGTNKVDAHRTINISDGGINSISRRADRKNKSSLLGFRLGGSLETLFNTFLLRSFAYVNLTRTRETAYTETGAGAANLTYQRHHFDNTNAEVGFELSQDYISDEHDVIITPILSCKWLGNFPFSHNKIRASFVNTNIPLSLTPRTLDDHAFSPGLALVGRWNKSGYLKAFYNAEFLSDAIGHEFGLRGIIFF